MEQENPLGLNNLDAWKKSLGFAVKVIQEVIPNLPAEEKYELGRQLRRSAQSIPANIAEGHGRFYYQETVRFCYIARGSLEETVSHIALARKLGYIQAELYSQLTGDANDLIRVINGYVSFLKRTRLGENEPGFQKSTRETSPPYSTVSLGMMNIKDEKYYP